MFVEVKFGIDIKMGELSMSQFNLRTLLLSMLSALILIHAKTNPVFAQTKQITESEARQIATKWQKSPRDENGNKFEGFKNSLSEKEISRHIMSVVLVVKGSTGYCGNINKPTWFVLWDKKASDTWGGFYPFMIDAASGKILDCRS